MSIITAGSAFTKGAEVLVTLVKSELLLVSQVSSDSYYSDSSNWKQVAIHYKSTVGNQREIMFFDATQSTPTAKFSVSLKSRNSFAVQKIVIKDFDNGSLEIPRAALNVVDFDVNLLPPLVLYNTRLFSSSYSLPAEGEVNVGNSSVIDGKLVQTGPSSLGTTSYRIIFPKSSSINTQTKSSNLKVRLYVHSIEGSGTYGVFWTDQGSGSALTATTSQISASVAANGYHELDLARLAYNAGGADYFNLCFDFAGSSSSDIIRISKFEILS